jgi:Zn-dependent protease
VEERVQGECKHRIELSINREEGLFASYCKNPSPQTHWWMGIIGAAGVFLSIIAHEFSHSLDARKYGLPMKGITLFIFGRVAEMEEEPASAKAEFMMAIAGSLSSST